MAAGSAGSAGSAGNAYVVDTDSPFQTDGLQDILFEKMVGKNNSQVWQQVQGLKTQKQKLLQAVDHLTETVGELRRKDGNMQYTQDYEYLYSQYLLAKQDAKTYEGFAILERKSYQKLLEAYNVLMEAYKLLKSNSVTSSREVKYELQNQIVRAQHLAKEASNP